jgi:putative colanic acid biosynthesis acetyltransferase WcaF
MYGFRNGLLRLFGAQVGRNVTVRPTVKVTFPWKVTIGDNAWIGDNVQLYSLGPIVIGDNAVVSQLCYLCTGSHDPAQVDFPIYAKTIVIEREAWLCADVFVMPGVTIGRGAVVGARSLVTCDIPPLALAKGQPARVVGERPGQSKQALT